MRRTLSRLMLLAVLAFAAVLALVVLSAAWFARPGAGLRADAIMVFGAGMDGDGTLHLPTRRRVQTGVALFEAGAAPWMLMTGGRAVPGGPSAADGMRDLAVSLGVPADAILVETESLSTLQNAVLSRPVLDAVGARRVIAVTEGFHMARAITSLRWSGIDVAGHQISTLYRGGIATSSNIVLREALAWPFNAGRVALWHAAGSVGVSDAARLRMLE